MRAALLAWVFAVAGCSKAPPCTLCGGTVCVDTRVDSANCGTCGVGCQAGTRCEQGSCVPTCAGLTCGNVCVDPRFDPSHCGACGVVCSAPHTTPTCIAGSCVRGRCDDGWRDCDFDERNGCESNVASCARFACATLSDGGRPDCRLRSISADGGRVLFTSFSKDLVPGDPNPGEELFLYDVATQRLRWMTQPVDGGRVATNVYQAVVSGDGERVAFVTFSSLLDGAPGLHYYVRDVQTAELTNLPTSDADSGVFLQSNLLTLSYDGRFLSSQGVTSTQHDCAVRIDTTSGAFFVKRVDGPLASSGVVALSGDGRVLGYLEFVDGEARPQLLDVESGVVRRVLDLADAGLADGAAPIWIVLDFDGSHAALSGQRSTPPFNWLAVAGPSGLIRYPDAGMAVFFGVWPSLSSDGRVVGFQRTDDSATSRCRVVDVTTGLPLRVTEAFEVCAPQLSTDGRVLAVDTSAGVFLVGVDRP